MHSCTYCALNLRSFARSLGHLLVCSLVRISFVRIKSFVRFMFYFYRFLFVLICEIWPYLVDIFFGLRNKYVRLTVHTSTAIPSSDDWSNLRSNVYIFQTIKHALILIPKVTFGFLTIIPQNVSICKIRIAMIPNLLLYSIVYLLNCYLCYCTADKFPTASELGNLPTENCTQIDNLLNSII